MSNKYTIRIYEDIEKRGSTSQGAILLPLTREMSIYADSADETERRLRQDIANGGLRAGRVYQICPWLANPEPIRSVAASLDGSFQRVFLDPACGLYCEERRIRLPEVRQPGVSYEAQGSL